jgi:hypothetical protein
MICTVYLLIDPRDHEIRYVGTSRYFKQRIRDTIATARRNWREGGADKSLWIRELLELGLVPRAEIMAQYANAKEAAEAELAWIRRLTKAGCVLYNHPRAYRIKPIEYSKEMSAAKACKVHGKQRISRWAI